MASNVTFDVGLGLEGTHVMITGAAGQIGQVVVQAFLSAGCMVSAMDLSMSHATLRHDRLLWIEGDITDEGELEQVFEQARAKFGIVSTCCAVAGLDLSFISHHETICDLPLEQWQRTIQVNTTGTFLTARTWLRNIKNYANVSSRNVSMIIFGSEAGTLGVPGNADYATSKAAIQYGLTRSLAPEAARIFARARVNAVAPGAVNTPQFRKECAEGAAVRYQDSEATVALKVSIPMEAVARTCLLLASETYSSHVTGQVIAIDGGKNGRVLWKIDQTPAW